MGDQLLEKRAGFKSMTEGSAEDFITIVVSGAEYSEGLVIEL